MTISGNSFKPEFFFVSPMEVVKVTTENLTEVAEWCGGEIAETESRRVKGRMDKYVWVPTPKGTKISWAFPGMYISKRMVVTLKDELVVTYSVFRKDYFSKNYFGTPNEAVEATWERAAKADRKAKIEQANKDRLAVFKKATNGAPIDTMLGTVLPHEDGGNVLVKDGVPHQSADIAGVPELPIGVEEVTKIITVAQIAEMEGISIEQAKDTIQVLEPFKPVYWHVGDDTYLVTFDEEDAQRETPHSPLPEPREAEEHEKIAEEMEPAPDDAASILEGDLTPDETLVKAVQLEGARRA